MIAELARGGIGDRSLRDIAAAVGTSHRMLIHHFGSREGLLAAVVSSVEEDQRRFLATLDPHPGEALDAMWQRLRDPALWPAERLFFDCYARAAHGEEPYASLLPGLVDDWLDRTLELGLAWPGAPNASAGDARAHARLGLAVYRGLLLDLVGTEDAAGVDAAFEVFRRVSADQAAGSSAPRGRPRPARPARRAGSAG